MTSAPPDRYASLVVEYDSLVAHARAVSEKLTGVVLDTDEKSYVDALFTKLLCHALSLRKISPEPIQSVEREIWDLSSACAIARALIESFDAMAYIALHQVTNSERQFRILLWKLHDQHRRLRMLDRVGSSDPRLNEMKLQAEKLETVLCQHPCFGVVSKEVQRKVKGGDAPSVHLSQKDLNAMTGIDHDYYVGATMFLSQYVHAHPMSLHQLIGFQAGAPEAWHLSSMPLQYAMPFIASAIQGMTTIWPEGVLDAESRAPSLEFWLTVAREGV